jgi:hypothetical protein
MAATVTARSRPPAEILDSERAAPDRAVLRLVDRELADWEAAEAKELAEVKERAATVERAEVKDWAEAKELAEAKERAATVEPGERPTRTVRTRGPRRTSASL